MVLFEQFLGLFREWDLIGLEVVQTSTEGTWPVEVFMPPYCIMNLFEAFQFQIQ
jgi:hypothetical protein